MEPTILGLALDSGAVIMAERKRQPILDFVQVVLELVHGVYRARTSEMSERRRRYIEELVSLVPVHPMTNRTAWLVGRLEGQEAAKGNVIPFNDLMIAAAAFEQEYAVLTANPRHFRMIPGLHVVPLEG